MKQYSIKFNKKPDYKSMSIIAGNISKLYNQGIHFLGIMELLKELPLSKSYKESITNMESLISIGKSLEEA
ncbi:hypothetical protein, partial [Clostridium sp.]|uniref:hypothetical protein n=1 Tax=Clostridium sp. TaxID=1506 RepID=UPI003F3D067A